MGNLMKYSAGDISQLLDRINKNSIGMDEYLNRVFDLHETTSNYPPYNLVTVSKRRIETGTSTSRIQEKASQCLHTRRKTLCRRTTRRWRNRDRVCPQRSGSKIFH